MCTRELESSHRESHALPPWVTMHRSQDCLCRCARHPAHPACIPPPYIRPRPGQPRPAQELASAPNHAAPRSVACAKPSTRKACAGAWSPTMRWARATGKPPAAGRNSSSWPLNPAHAPHLTPARHARKAPQTARFCTQRVGALRVVVRPPR